MELSQEMARCIIDEDGPFKEGEMDVHDWDAVTDERIDDNGRWSISYSRVFKYKGKYYEFYWSRGATEYQDEQPFDCESIVKPTEVKMVERMVISFEPLKYKVKCSECKKQSGLLTLEPKHCPKCGTDQIIVSKV